MDSTLMLSLLSSFTSINASLYHRSPFALFYTTVRDAGVVLQALL